MSSTYPRRGDLSTLYSPLVPNFLQWDNTTFSPFSHGKSIAPFPYKFCLAQVFPTCHPLNLPAAVHTHACLHTRTHTLLLSSLCFFNHFQHKHKLKFMPRGSFTETSGTPLPRPVSLTGLVIGNPLPHLTIFCFWFGKKYSRPCIFSYIYRYFT